MGLAGLGVLGERGLGRGLGGLGIGGEDLRVQGAGVEPGENIADADPVTHIHAQRIQPAGALETE